MAFSVVQSVQTPMAGTATATLGSPTTTGNVLIALVFICSQTAPSLSISDSKGNAWKDHGPAPYGFAGGNGFWVAVQTFAAPVTAAGSTTVTLGGNTAAGDTKVITLLEVSGVGGDIYSPDGCPTVSSFNTQTPTTASALVSALPQPGQSGVTNYFVVTAAVQAGATHTFTVSPAMTASLTAVAPATTVSGGLTCTGRVAYNTAQNITPGTNVGFNSNVTTTGAHSVCLMFYASPCPTITGILPSSGTTAGGTAVTITGTGFVATPSPVYFGAAAASSIAFVNSTTLTALSASHAAGSISVSVLNPDGQKASGSVSYTYATPQEFSPRWVSV